MLVNRIAVIYRDQHQVIHDDDALGLTGVQVSIQGLPPRPSREPDLFAVRSWLHDNGFTRIETADLDGAHRGNGYERTFKEYWDLHPHVPQSRKEITMRTQIEYDHASKQYKLYQDIDTLGVYATRPEAETAQIHAENPALGALLARFLAQHPAFESRAIKAAHMVLRGDVCKNGHPHTYDVLSGSHIDREYSAHIPPDAPAGWLCFICHDASEHKIGSQCPDHKHETAPQTTAGHRRCKHQIAALFLSLLDRQADPPPRPQQIAPPAATDEAKTTDNSAPVTSQHTTPPPVTSSPEPRVIARYADGRPARLENGNVIRYTAGGQAVELPAASW